MFIKNLKPYSVLRSKHTGKIVYVATISYLDETLTLCKDPELNEYIGTIYFEQLEHDFVSDVEYKLIELFKV